MLRIWVMGRVEFPAWPCRHQAIPKGKAEKPELGLVTEQVDGREAGTAGTTAGLWPQPWDLWLEGRMGSVGRNSKIAQKPDSCQNRTEQGSEGAPWEQRFKPSLEVCLPGVLGARGWGGAGPCTSCSVVRRGTEMLRPRHSWLECTWHVMTLCAWPKADVLCNGSMLETVLVMMRLP